MTDKAMRKYVNAGRVIGARQDARSRKWTISLSAKLVDKSGDVMKRREPAAARGKFPPPAGVACAPPAGFSTGSVEAVDVGTSPHGLSADRLQPAQETREVSDNRPPAKRGFNAFEGGADRGDGHAENVYRDPETRRVLEVLREVAARQFREGLHYLRLDAREFAQLYAALDNDRRHENGYWEVCYPYFYSEGTRGPCLKRQQRQPDKPKKPEFAEHSPEW